MPAGSNGAIRSAGPKWVMRPSAMATMASGSWTIVASRPSRKGSPIKLSAGPRTAVGREREAAISFVTLASKALGRKLARADHWQLRNQPDRAGRLGKQRPDGAEQESHDEHRPQYAEHGGHDHTQPPIGQRQPHADGHDAVFGRPSLPGGAQVGAS